MVVVNKKLGKENLRTSTGWSSFFLVFFFGPPPGPYPFPGKIIAIVRAGDFFVHLNL